MLLTLLTIHLLALMTPGPDFLIVSRTAIASSRRAAVWTALGIALGVAAWASAALAGLNLLLAQMVWLRVGVQVAGGAYLIYIGAMMLRASASASETAQDGAASAEIKDAVAFRSGLLTNLANPKAAIYFGSIFATFLGASTALASKKSILVLVCLESLLWFLLVATLFSTPSFRRAYSRAQRWIDRVAGVAFVLLGAKVLLSINL